MVYTLNLVVIIPSLHFQLFSDNKRSCKSIHLYSPMYKIIINIASVFNLLPIKE